MQKHATLIKILATAGTVFVWLPLIAPLAFGLFRLIAMGRLRVDYLMPAELFPVELAGCLMLAVAARLARSHARLIIAGSVLAAIFLFGFGWVAQVSGLASGAIEPQGMWFAIVLAGVALYILALIVVGVGGILLLRRVFGKEHPLQSLPA